MKSGGTQGGGGAGRTVGRSLNTVNPRGAAAGEIDGGERMVGSLEYVLLLEFLASAVCTIIVFLWYLTRRCCVNACWTVASSNELALRRLL